MRNKVKSSLATKISLMLVGMIMLCAMTAGIAAITLYRSDFIDASAHRALDIAHAAAALIDPEQFAETMQTLEKDEHWHTAKKGLDEIATRTDITYLYALGSSYTDSVTYFAEGIRQTDTPDDAIDLGGTEPIVIDGKDTYPAAMYEVLKDGVPRVSPVYKSGDFGAMVSGFAPIIDQNGAVVGVIGADLTLNQITGEMISFAVSIALVVLVFCVIFSVLCPVLMRRSIGKPLAALTQAADQMAGGDVDVQINLDRTDEIGMLAAAFARMSAYTKLQVDLLKQLAGGNLTMQITARGPKDAMSLALQGTVSRLNRLFADIQESARQVSLGSQQIAAGAEHLATGSTEQSAMLQQFAASLHEVLQTSQHNAEQAEGTYTDTQQTSTLMEKSMHSMDEMTRAMKNINDSAQQIGSVIRAIDDIAFQTNILALNAAVEAARAGQNGKGFAVVADEVRNLANKSAEAARETTAMIQNSLRNVSEGNQLTTRTGEQIQHMAKLAALSANALHAISAASQHQTETISKITEGIGQISSVVQVTSATAEQSAAAAQEISLQAQRLNDSLSQFQTR